MRGGQGGTKGTLGGILGGLSSSVPVFDFGGMGIRGGICGLSVDHDEVLACGWVEGPEPENWILGNRFWSGRLAPKVSSASDTTGWISSLW